MRRSRRSRLGALLAALVVGSATPATATAIVSGTGYDVSYPVCGVALPVGATFGIVGVNGGLANNANPCLAIELAWAAATPGQPGQPAASLYVNTADPGPRVPDWPTLAFGTAHGPTPIGPCDGSWSPACGYLYGALRATASYQLVAAINAGVGPTGAPWWLDIETVSSWAKPTDLPTWAAVNIATIEGFVAGLRASGAAGPIGFYSTQLQWMAITGLDAASSPGQLTGNPPDWVAGTGSVTEAQAACQASFSGGQVKLAQYAGGGFDQDYACPPVVAPGLHVVSHTRRTGALVVTGVINPAYRGRVAVGLTANHAGAVYRTRRSAIAVAGRWQVVLTLPRRGRLTGAKLVAQSSAADGLTAGLAHAAVRLSP